MKQRLSLFSLVLLSILSAQAQTATPFTWADTLMGSNTPGRAWWDVQRYDLTVAPDYETKTIQGRVRITYIVLANPPSGLLQLDLQKPMVVDSLYVNGVPYVGNPAKPISAEGHHWFVPMTPTPVGSTQTLTVVYHGKPREATNPPWDGGWVWAKDKQGRPWMSVACQGDGASLWFPCKDYWADEPDRGASLTVIAPAGLTAVGNGRLKDRTSVDGKQRFTWEVVSPINSYNIVPYIGHYTTWTDTLVGENGPLDLAYWVLDYELENAKRQFAQVKPTLRAFEHWFGPYPFYRDGYQLVQSPYLGMEHQSAVAYGNAFKNGYLGTDLSSTGWGLKWDYIIVHETGHEWFGNNITAKDRADMWVQEAFTDYSESLFIETYFGKKAANEYTQGLRRNIVNDRPIIGPYGVNREGSGDMYFKGSNFLHTLRQVLNNDQRFRQVLRGLNKTFYHSNVTSQDVEKYISRQCGQDFSKLFDQYLRRSNPPLLEWRTKGSNTQYRWADVVPGFAMPLRLASGQWIKPTTIWQTIRAKAIELDKNFYILLRKL